MTASSLITTLRRVALGGATLAVLAPAVVHAAPTVGTPVPLGGEGPRHLAVAADGTLWLTLDSATDDVARVKDGVVTKFNDPAVNNANGITIDGAGNVWVTRQGGVAKFSPSDPANMTETDIAALNASPRNIVLGRDGNLWTASDDKLVKIPVDAPATFVTRTLPGLAATSIAASDTGHLWISEFGNERLTRVSMTGGEPESIAVGGNPQGVAAAPAGVVGVAVPSAPHRVSLRTAAGEFAAPAVSGDPFGITYGADGAFWTARFADHSVGRVTLAGGVERFALPAGSGPRQIAAGTNAVWVGLETAKSVVQIAGVEAPPAPPAGGPGGAAAGNGDTTAPQITDVSLLRSTFRAGKRPAPPTAGKRGVGTRLHLTLSEEATLTVAAERLLPGRRDRAGKCAAPKRSLTKRPSCVRTKPAGTLLRERLAGTLSVSLDGRVKGKRLAPGKYRLLISAKDAAGNTSAVVRRTVRVTSR